MLTCHFCTAQLTSFNEWYIFTSMYVTGQHKNKQISDRLEYITHLHQHTWSIHNSYVSKMCIQNIANIFAGFWIRAYWKTAKSANISVLHVHTCAYHWRSGAGVHFHKIVMCDASVGEKHIKRVVQGSRGHGKPGKVMDFWNVFPGLEKSWKMHNYE